MHVLKKEVDTSQHAETCMAYCQQHRDYCSTFKQPTAIPGGSTAIRFLVAGINCFDWSIRGSQDGWLGQSCLSYFEIMREVLTCQYDLVIFECVREFDESGLEPFAEHYAIQSLTFSPTPLGLPCSRMRKYMMMALKSSFEWIPEVGSFGARAMFGALFTRSLQLYGHQLFAAPQAKIEEMRAQMVEARGMPAKRRSGKCWSFFQALPPGIRANVHRLDTMAKADPYSGKAMLLTATQRHKFQSAMPVCPAILRKTLIWSTELKRPGHYLELFEVMGYKMFGFTECAEPSVAAAFAKAIQDLSPKHASSLSGNGMHLTAMGCAYLFILSCCRRKAAATE